MMTLMLANPLGKPNRECGIDNGRHSPDNHRESTSISNVDGPFRFQDQYHHFTDSHPGIEGIILNILVCV
jgi:hypothetical protein